MWDNMIGRQIRRSSRNLLIWNALILIGIIVFFVLSSRYWYNFFAGPFPLTAEQVTALTDDSGLEFYVKVHGDICIDSGSREITVTKKHGVEQSRRETAKHLHMLFGDKLLIVKADMDSSPSDMERRGVLKMFKDEMDKPDMGPGPGGRPLPQGGAPQNRKPGAAERPVQILPVVLDTTITRTKGFIGLAILIPLGLLNIFNIFKAFSRYGNPQNHPLAKALLKYGDPEEVAQKIEDEYASDDRQQVGPATLTRSWLIRPTTFGVDAMFLGDSAWAYKTVTQHYTNGVPTGKTYAANLCDIHGKMFTLQLKSEDMCNEFVQAIFARVPWVLAGYDAELERLWKKDKTQLFAIVDERRKQLAEEIRRRREQPDEVEPVNGNDGPLDVEPA